MVDKIVSLIQNNFSSIFDSVLVNKISKNNVDYYHIVTNKPFNLIISYEYYDKIWNLYITYDNTDDIEEVKYSEFKSLSGMKDFYSAQNKYVKGQVGFIRYAFNSRETYKHYLQFFAQYIRENINDL